MLRLALALVVLAGCHKVFSLERLPDAREPDAAVDSDGDGLFDSADNCRNRENPDQADGDSDGFGDACDVCPQLADDQHDEDDDAVGDRCDNCPHLANSAQDNSDGDQLGDSCDSSMTQQCVPLFDGFATLDAWSVHRGTWMIENDQVVQTDPEIVQGFIGTLRSFTSPLALARGAAVSFGSLATHHVGVWGAATVVPGRVIPNGYIAEIIDPADDHAFLVVSHVIDDAGLQIYNAAKLVPYTNLPGGSKFEVLMDLRAAPSWYARGRIEDSVMAGANSNAPAVTAPIGLRAHGAIVRYDWVLVVTEATTACPPR